MNFAGLDISIRELGGIGPKLQACYQALGISTVSNLIQLQPRGYEDRSHRVCIGSNQDCSMPVNTLVEVVGKSFFGKGMKNVKILVQDTQSGARAELLGFNRSYLDHSVFCGSYYQLYGYKMPSNGYSREQYSQFEIKPVSEAQIQNEDLTLNKGLLPVYPLSAGLTQNNVRRDVKNALLRSGTIEDILPQSVMRRYRLISFDSAIRKMHNPQCEEDIVQSHRTLAFAEIFYLQMFSLRHSKNSSKRGGVKKIYTAEQLFIESLPFKLTDDQVKVLDEIRTDMSSQTPMNRLLQGDVGSGKTLVAWVSAIHAVSQGSQVAFMAPTELLARQHAQNASVLFENTGLTVGYLDGQVHGSSRKSLLKALKEGQIDILIGTHALFSKDVQFRNLGFVIIDEQHRFGVEQRASLFNKGTDPDILLMTATPIPRTLALTLYGNLNVSTIKTMPQGRLPVKTFLVDSSRREDMYRSVGVELERGHQVYFVYPRIENSEDSESNLRDVTTMYGELSKRYEGFSGELIHSKLDDDVKIDILNRFSSGDLRFLVSTSVVEVGIDVKNATCMVIEHADTFGLSALHQLRGRVGRSTLQSWCFLAYENGISDDAKKRLKALHDTNDGFVIAEEDLKIRGPGEITGLKQSGFVNLKYASLDKDINMFASARQEVLEILEKDPGLIEQDNCVVRSLLQDRQEEAGL